MATTIANAELRKHVKSGKLRTLAVMSERSAPGMEGVPAFKEKGHDLQFSGWRGIAVSKTAPEAALDYWRNMARKVSESPSFQAIVIKQNLTPAFANALEFSAAIARQHENFRLMWPTLEITQ